MDSAKKTRHMRYSGSVSVSDATFGAVAHDVAVSAIAAGFKNVALMGDHGGDQSTLAKVARSWIRSGDQKELTGITFQICTTKKKTS